MTTTFKAVDTELFVKGYSRSHDFILSKLSMIVRVNIVRNRTVVDVD